MIWSRLLPSIYETDNILELNYKFCKRKDGLKVNIYVLLVTSHDDRLELEEL
jgi:hypothetical protein